MHLTNLLPSQIFTLTLLFHLLNVTLAHPASATQCPASPCKTYDHILATCKHDHPAAPIYNPLKPLPNTAAISCICSDQLFKGTAHPDQTGLEWAITCYDCSQVALPGYDVLVVWLEVCETAKHAGLARARECWNSGISKGCWRAEG